MTNETVAENEVRAVAPQVLREIRSCMDIVRGIKEHNEVLHNALYGTPALIEAIPKDAKLDKENKQCGDFELIEAAIKDLRQFLESERTRYNEHLRTLLGNSAFPIKAG